MLRSLGPRISGLLHPCGLLSGQSRLSTLLVPHKPSLALNSRHSVRCSAVRRRIKNSRSTSSREPSENTTIEGEAKWKSVQHTSNSVAAHTAAHDPSHSSGHLSAAAGVSAVTADPSTAATALHSTSSAAAAASGANARLYSSTSYSGNSSTATATTDEGPADLSDYPTSSEPYTPPLNTLCGRLLTPSSEGLCNAESSFVLRDYQVEAIRTVIQSWKQQVGAQLVMLPTGTGKTVVFAALARYMAQSYSRELAPPPAAAANIPSSSGVAEAAAGGIDRGSGPVVAAAAAAGGAGEGKDQSARSQDPANPSNSSSSSSSGSGGGSSSRGGDGGLRSGYEALSHAAAAGTPADDQNQIDLDHDLHHDHVHSQDPGEVEDEDEDGEAEDEPADNRSDSYNTDPEYAMRRRDPKMQADIHRRFMMVGKTGDTRYFDCKITDDGEFIVDEPQWPTLDQPEPDTYYNKYLVVEDHDEYEEEYEVQDLDHDDEDDHDDGGDGSSDGDDQDDDGDGQAAGGHDQIFSTDPGSSSSNSSPSHSHSITQISSSSDKQQQQQHYVDPSSMISSPITSRRRSRRRSTTTISSSSRSSRSLRSGSSTSSNPSLRNPDQMRVLVLAHRGELLQQAAEKFDLIWPGVTVSWVKGQRKNFWGQVVLASVQTAVNCIDQLRECAFSLVVVDEAHHSVANTYKEVLKGLGFVEELNINPSSSSSSSSSSRDEDNAMQILTNNSSSSSGLGVVAAAASSAMILPTDSSIDEDSYGPMDGSSSNAGSSSSSMLRALYSPHALLVGFTATPYRMRKDESAALYQIFVQTYTQNIVDMIRKKYLCRITSRKIFTEVDLKGARSLQGDFTPSTLAPIVNSPERNKLVLQAYLDYCTESATAAAGSSNPSSSSSSSSSSSDDVTMTSSGLMTDRRVVRKTIGFAVDIAHAEALNQMFSKAGVRSAVVHSQVPGDENSQLLREFKQGELDVLWNVEKLTEGYDEPSLDAVLMARPTKSTGLYTQMLGRGLRRWPGKEDCLVLDFSDKFHRADRVVDVRLLLDNDGSLFKNLDPQPPQTKDREHKLKLKGLQGGEVSVIGESIDPLDLNWKKYGDHWMCDLFNMGKIWLVNTMSMGNEQRQKLGLQVIGSSTAADDDDEDDEWETLMESPRPPKPDRYAVLHQPPGWRDSDKSENNAMTWRNATPHALHGMTASDAYGAALDYMSAVIKQQNQQSVRRRIAGKSFKPPAKLDTFRKDSHWRDQPMGDKQRRFLIELKVSPEPHWTKGQASDAIAAALCGLATQQQYEQLKVKLSPEDYESLPVPLLCAHARALGAEP